MSYYSYTVCPTYQYHTSIYAIYLSIANNELLAFTYARQHARNGMLARHTDTDTQPVRLGLNGRKS